MERRRSVRYLVNLDCTVSALSKPEASLSGKTLNMSNCGVLVWIQADGPLPAMAEAGESMRVVLELPQAPYSRGCWLDCMCRVVRVYEQAFAHLVAFDVKRYHFRPFSESASGVA